MTRPPIVFTYEQEPVVQRLRSAAPSKTSERAAGDVPADWKLKRDPPRPHDMRLSPLAVQWFEALPATLKPAALCERFPRIANRLSIAWKDATLAALLLAELLEDRRGGRKGFPLEVRVELIRLAAEVKARQLAPAVA